jgi:hypothetical protein
LSPTLWLSHREHSFRDRTRPREKASTNNVPPTDSYRVKKCLGADTPRRSIPTRWATAMYSTESVIGSPRPRFDHAVQIATVGPFKALVVAENLVPFGQAFGQELQALGLALRALPQDPKSGRPVERCAFAGRRETTPRAANQGRSAHVAGRGSGDLGAAAGQRTVLAALSWHGSDRTEAICFSIRARIGQLGSNCRAFSRKTRLLS